MRLLFGEELWRPGVEGVAGKPASCDKLESGEDGEGSGLRR